MAADDALARSGFGPALDALPVVAFDLDVGGNVLWMSAWWTTLTGQSLDDARGLGWMQALDAAGLTLVGESVARALTGGEVVTYVVRARARGGEWVWLRTWLRGRLEGGRPVGFIGLAVPVADAADSAQEQQLHRADVAKLEASADALLAATPDLLIHLSADGVYLGIRAGDPAKLVRRADQLLGQPLEAVLPPSVAADSRAALARARATGQVQTVEYRLPMQGGARDFEARITPMQNGEFLCIVRDVTDARSAQAELVRAKEEALELSRQKAQFLANVSHEIRTPLNAILGVTQLLEQQHLAPELGEYLGVLQGAGDALLALVNDVLDLSRIDANRLELEARVFDLEPLVTSVVKALTVQAQRKGLALVLAPGPGGRGPVRGDAARVRQVLTNLVANAVKFTEAGHVRLAFARVEGDVVRFEVEDTGPGIAPDDHARIFAPFQQVGPAARRLGGTGLGLTISRRLAQLMGGDVRVESSPGQGARFLVELPLPAVVIDAGAPVFSRSTPPPRALSVVVAQADEGPARAARSLLEALGHRVEVASSGPACVQLVAAGGVDLVLLDGRLPGLDAVATLRALRELEQGGPRLFIVGLTGGATAGEEGVRALAAGMDAWLPQPITLAALQDLLAWFGSHG